MFTNGAEHQYLSWVIHGESLCKLGVFFVVQGQPDQLQTRWDNSISIVTVCPEDAYSTPI